MAGALAHARDDLSSILQGGNVLTNLSNIATTFAGTALHVVDPFAGNAAVNNILNNPILNGITLGITGNLASFGNVASDLQSGTQTNNLQTKDVQGTFQLVAKGAAIATGAALLTAPTTVAGGIQTYGAAATLNKAASSGNFLGAGLAVAGTVADNVDLTDDTYDTVSQGLDAANLGAKYLPNGGSSRGTPARQTVPPANRQPMVVQGQVQATQLAQPAKDPAIPAYLVGGLVLLK